MENSTEILQYALLGTTATFAGMGITINFVAGPAILDSADPGQSFFTLCSRKKQVAMLTVLPSVAAAGFLYYQTQDNKFLIISILNFLTIPYSRKFMAPIKHHVMYNCKADDTGKAQHLIEKWSTRQWFQTIVGVTTFAIAVHAILNKQIGVSDVVQNILSQ